jgi:hypothetical protein
MPVWTGARAPEIFRSAPAPAAAFDFGLEKIIEIVLILLNSRIFQSELKAKIAFPELFRTTPSRDVQRAEAELLRGSLGLNLSVMGLVRLRISIASV